MHAWVASHKMHDRTERDHDYIKCRPASKQQNNV